MGDPFSAENLSLEQRETNYPRRPDQPHFLNHQSSSTIAEEDLKNEQSGNHPDTEPGEGGASADKTVYALDKQPAKAFQFEFSPRFRPWSLLVIGVLLLCIVILAVALGVELKKSFNNNNPTGAKDMLLSQTDTPLMSQNHTTSVDEPSSSLLPVTTSSTITSGFVTVTIPITATQYPTASLSLRFESYVPSASIDMPAEQTSRLEVTYTETPSMSQRLTPSPSTASSSSSKTVVPDWLGSLITRD